MSNGPASTTTQQDPTTTGGINNALQPVPGLTGTQTGTESTLSNWAGEYVTDMLGKGRALSENPYEAYQGPLTAGASGLQSQAFQGAGNLQIPQADMGTFTPQSYTDEGVAQQYMNPFLEQMLRPQLEELQRQADRQRIAQAGRLTNAGAYGGSRQAIMESELARNLLDEVSQLTGQAYAGAYDRGATQFNTEQDRQRATQEQTNRYGFDVLQRLQDLGAVERGVEAEGVRADREQFEQELAFPYKQLTFQQSLLDGLPVSSKDYTYTEPGQLAQLLSTTQGVSSAVNDIFGAGTVSNIGNTIGDLVGNLFGGSDPNQFQSGYNSAGDMVDYFRAGGIVNNGRNIK